MKRRMFDSSIWSKHKFARLPYAARLLQLGLINLADDQGRMLAHPAYLRSQVFPYDEDVTTANIRDWLALIAANGTAIIYADSENEYIQLLNWWEYQTLQYASPSEHPRPNDWHDRIRYNAKGGAVLACNWTTPRGETTIDTCDEDGDPLPIAAELPPRNPGGRPPKNPPANPGENPPANPNKDHDQDQVKEEGKREATAKPSKPAPHPAVVVFHDVWNRNPNKPQMKTISEHITDLELWRDACQSWGDRGHKPTNVEGMIDWYDHPERFRTAYRSPPNGGDYAPGRSTNNGVNAIVDYAQEKGMFK